MKPVRMLAPIAALAMISAFAAPASAAPTRLPSSFFTVDVNAVGYYLSTAGTPPSKAAGSPMVQREAGNALTFLWTQTSTYNGNPAGTLQLTNGNFAAANNACSGVTVKSGSTGSIWEAVTVSGPGSTYRFVNRSCDQAAGGHNNQYLEADGFQNDQFKVGNNSGYDTVMFIHVPS